MKRILAVLFVVAFAFTLVSGCACTQDAKKCTELCQDAMTKLDSVQKSCQDAAMKADQAAARAEAAARRAEAAADKCENIFMKKMKK
jgi:hypothetical protein